jgi:ribosomal protein S18 acetylase RimI-like enzyme
MNSLNIRHATIKDLDACDTIESASFAASEAASRVSLETRIKVFSDGFLVAELDGKVVGQVNSGATNKDDITDEAFKQLIGHEAGGKHLVIFSLSVLPQYRHQGIATHLLRSLIQVSRNEGRSTILLLCKLELISYYQRFGFVDCGKSASTHGGVPWHEMALNLTGASDP